MSKFKVVILDTVYSAYEQEKRVLEDIGAEVIVIDKDSMEQRQAATMDADGLLVNLNSVDKSLIDGMKKCKVISRYGVGFDNVDVP
ncbi:MAG: C-terminal binding protein, partial [Spirochaetales bacterium]|nr:C-terminal binding protein [Spirochaetales bacterium]